MEDMDKNFEEFRERLKNFSEQPPSQCGTTFQNKLQSQGTQVLLFRLLP